MLRKIRRQHHRGNVAWRIARLTALSWRRGGAAAWRRKWQQSAALAHAIMAWRRHRRRRSKMAASENGALA
jgi:hypothetical protein